LSGSEAARQKRNHQQNTSAKKAAEHLDSVQVDSEQLQKH
jgi:hypothetical protein